MIAYSAGFDGPTHDQSTQVHGPEV
jgi:hypothetical protein